MMLTNVKRTGFTGCVLVRNFILNTSDKNKRIVEDMVGDRLRRERWELDENDRQEKIKQKEKEILSRERWELDENERYKNLREAKLYCIVCG